MPRSRHAPRPRLGAWPCPSRPSARCGANFATRCAGSTAAGACSSRSTASTARARRCSRTGSRDVFAEVGTTVFRSSIDGFHRPRSERYARGRRSPEGFYRDSYDYPTFRRVLIDPFREGWQTAATTGFQLEAFDLARDAPVESAWVAAPRDAVLIVDGIFLHRPELRDLWDWSVWLDVPYEVAYARMALRDGCDPDPDAPSNARYRQRPGALPRRGGPAGRGIRHRRQRRPRAPAPRRRERPLMVAAGVLLVDKPGGMTSHDVVARARRALGTRKIGHAGTLDPMATGLLILGVEGATRLLTFIVGLDKTYEATIRLGVATDTDDAEGAETSASGCRGPRRGHPRAHRRRRRGAHRADLAGAEHGVGDQGRRATGVRPRARGRRGRAEGPRGHGVEVRDPRRRGASPASSTSTSSSTARAAPTSARWRGTSAPRSASAGTSRRCAEPGSARSTSRTRHPPTTSPTPRSPPLRPSRPPCSAASTSPPTRRATCATASASRAPRRGSTPIPTAAIDPDGALVGIVERRGDDVKSVMNMPEEARPMILWFTYVEVIVGGRGGTPLHHRGTRRAARRATSPSARWRCVELLLLAQIVIAIIAPFVGNPPTGQPPRVLGVPRVGRAPADRRGRAGRCSSAAAGAPSSWASPRSRSRSWCGGCRSSGRSRSPEPRPPARPA